MAASPVAEPALSRLGPAKLDEAFALGRFNTFARQAQRNGNPEGVDNVTHTIFAPLLRSGDGWGFCDSNGPT
ncbi:MAG: hypothetical protein H7Z12_08750 [Rhodospirillaceae bacterium]|nr:hypothetical protein [Rhodospirillales bacterium]